MALAIALAVTSPCLSEELVATQPSVVCASASALDALTAGDHDRQKSRAKPRAMVVRAPRAGCTGVATGTRVTVRKSLRTSSIVSYGPAAKAMAIPNIDFRRLPEASTNDDRAQPDLGALPAGYRLQQVLILKGAMHSVIELLEDRRITPAIRASLLNGHADTGEPIPADAEAASQQPPL